MGDLVLIVRRDKQWVSIQKPSHISVFLYFVLINSYGKPRSIRGGLRDNTTNLKMKYNLQPSLNKVPICRFSPLRNGGLCTVASYNTLIIQGFDAPYVWSAVVLPCHVLILLATVYTITVDYGGIFFRDRLPISTTKIWAIPSFDLGIFVKLCRKRVEVYYHVFFSFFFLNLGRNGTKVLITWSR